MILDGLLMFDNAAALTVSRVSTNTLDLLNARDLGVDPELKMVFVATTTFTASGAATLNVDFQGSADNSTWQTYASSATLSLAQLNSGGGFGINWPRAVGVIPRYIRLNYTVGTGPYTAGALTATLARDVGAPQLYYPPGIAIST